MKNKIVVILVLFITACSQKNERKTAVNGLYVTSYQSEYSKAMDTIEITPLNEEANTFRYVRRTGYGRITNGVIGPYEHKIENSTCVYNEGTAQLNEERHGRVYSLSGDGNQLVSGNSIYKRIQ